MNEFWARLGLPDRLLMGGTLLALIGIFLPWYGLSYGIGAFHASASVDGFHSWGYLAFLGVLAGIGALIARGVVAQIPVPAMSFPLPVGYLVAGGLQLVGPVLFLLLHHQHASGPGFSVGPEYGVFVGIVAGAVSLAAGVLARQANLTALPSGSSAGQA
ncbi:MAG: hypothetical protein ACYDAQ_09340 [Mycobacteriales bacterium]